jgi:hypothetical protein
MSKRRTAERAVIDAAMRYVTERRQGLSYSAVCARHDDLVAAVNVLELLDLEPATATRTISLPLATSEEAAQYMSKSVHRVAGLVFREILTAFRQGAMGLTTDAIEVRLNRSHQSVSPRVTDLRDQGWIEPAMKIRGGTEVPCTRPTRYGQQATVWMPTQAALAAADQVKEWSW